MKDGRRVYGNVGANPQDAAAFEVPADTEHLWLVVMGAPAEHWPVAMGRGRRSGGSAAAEEQWPYQIKLTGAGLDDAFIQ